MPATVPEANPPRPSVSSHSALLSEGNDILDPGGFPKQQLSMRSHRVPSGDQGTGRGGPAAHENAEVAYRALKGLASSVHGAKDDLILQHQVPHKQIGVNLDRRLATGHAGEDED